MVTRNSSNYTSGNSATLLIGQGQGSVPIWSGSLITSPAASSVVTAGFGSSLTAGTPVQNTLGYDVLLNLSVNLSLVTLAGTVTLGVGPTSTPTANAVTASLAAATTVSFTALVPSGYYVVVSTTGTITVGSITVQAMAI